MKKEKILSLSFHSYILEMKKDIIIIGAGLSGIGAACHLKRDNPDKSYLILESREEFGGTWRLFKYPGIRSDSDLNTFGYNFKPWGKQNTFGSAKQILTYLDEAMEEYNVKEQVVFNQKVISANFDSETATWTINTLNTKTGETEFYESNIIFSCSGYYSYDKGYTPKFEGLDNYLGTVIHPQNWDENLDYTNKKIIVIGSGATAITLIPSLTEKAEKVTMLQRSPSYIGAIPAIDKIAVFLNKILPKKVAYRLIRLKNISFQVIFFTISRKWPKKVKNYIINQVKKGLGDDFPVEPHFVPKYNPWEQRFCLAPDGDFYKVLKNKKADIVTDHIDKFTEKGILLKSGKELEADIVVTATGLNLLAFGGVELSVDNKQIELSEQYVYKGLMLNDVPNIVFFVGYTNASWTLKSDLTSKYASRLLNYMDKNNKLIFNVKTENETIEKVPILNLDSSYIKRNEHLFPKQGNKTPWRVYQNYFLDFYFLRIKSIHDKYLKF